eukprot:4361904-Prymnesium_polylepis.2
MLDANVDAGCEAAGGPGRVEACRGAVEARGQRGGGVGICPGRAIASLSQGRDSTCTRPPLASAGIVRFTRLYAHPRRILRIVAYNSVL